MLYFSSDYGRTWTAVPDMYTWMDDRFQRLKMALEKAGYATKYESHPPVLIETEPD